MMFVSGVRSFLIIVVCTLLAGFNAGAAEYISDRDGNWGDTNTWAPEEGDETFPQAGDEAYANHNINVESAHFCGILHSGDGNNLTINPGASLTVYNGGTWGSGTIRGSGPVYMNGTFTFDAEAGPRYLENMFVNSGTLQHTTAGNLFINGGTFSNRAGAVYDLQGDLEITNSTGSAAYFRNEGTFTKSSGAGLASIGNVRFEVVNGTVNVKAGTLRAAGSEATCRNPTFNVDEGCTYEMIHGVRAYFNGTMSGPGPGEVLFSTGTLATCSDSADAYLAFTNGGFHWTGGEIIPYNGRCLVNIGKVNLDGSYTKRLHSGPFRNEGYMSQAGSGPFKVDYTFTNAAGGVYDIQADGVVVTGSSHFYNSGILQKSAGGGESAFQQVIFHNNGGTIEVQTGTLWFAGTDGSSRDGTFNIAEGARLELVRGFRNAYNGTYSGSGAGAVAHVSDGLICGTDGSDTYVNFTNGGFHWEGGSITPYNGSFANLGLMILTGASTKTVSARPTRNLGTTLCYGGGPLKLDAAFSNAADAVFQMLGSGTNISGGQTFFNSGTFSKPSGSYTSIVAAPFTEYAGEASVNDGRLEFTQDVNVNGGTVRLAGGTLVFRKAAYFAGGALRGTGVLENTIITVRNGGRIAPGNSAGVITVTNAVTFDNTGILDVELGGTAQGTEYDLLQLGGAATLNGTVDVHLVNGFIPTTNDVFEIMRFGSRSGTFIKAPHAWQVAYTSTNLTLRLRDDSLVDTDGDDLPDWWESLHFGGPTNAIAGANGDTDPFTNLEEYQLHTDPTNGASCLQMLTPAQATTPEGNWLVKWASDTGIVYMLDRNTNLGASAWTSLLTATGTVESTTITDATDSAATPRFYRVRVSLP